MCLILFSFKNHDKYKLVIAANRDEFYERPTDPAKFWDDSPEVLAGKDLEAGGTWMGVSTQGKIALLTNYRDLKNIRKNAPSRGHLVGNYLKSQQNAYDFLSDIPENGQLYNGYNIIMGNKDHLYYQSNYSEGITEITPGIHGLSNQLLNSPWPKVVRGTEKLSNLLKKEFETEDIFNLLYDNDSYPLSSLPDTGIGEEMEKVLSPMFIKSPKYGSRCSTMITIDWNDHLHFVERSYNINDFSFTEKEYMIELKH